MHFGLEKGRHKFISEFIEREDVVDSYLTVEKLRDLYKTVFTTNPILLSNLQLPEILRFLAVF